MAELVAALTGRIRASGQQLVLTLIAYAIVALLLLSAYVAFMYALGLAIAAEFSPVIAALSIAIATLVIALAIVVWLKVRGRRLERRRAIYARSAVNAGSAAAMATMVPMMIRASPVGSLVAVAVLAYVVSRAGQRDRR
ncbi:hypothetical protein IHQ71_03850 [Rhizobium sp. TH2]|uniref:hypothetical protein n=1 Tax=Rhizobium sp. TH2 TaxID=2775403 RepID=UPI0021586A16|nr:hypothetical protein [Rhizobium sp. TH2]UVC09760.1 hypothetical protein IHQ71_03850 [Rhizobium sp. TH2]